MQANGYFHAALHVLLEVSVKATRWLTRVRQTDTSMLLVSEHAQLYIAKWAETIQHVVKLYGWGRFGFQPS